MSKKEGNNTNISKQLEEIAEEVCEKLCKYAEQYKKEYADNDEALEKLFEEKCESCKVCNLL